MSYPYVFVQFNPNGTYVFLQENVDTILIEEITESWVTSAPNANVGDYEIKWEFENPADEFLLNEPDFFNSIPPNEWVSFTSTVEINMSNEAVSPLPIRFYIRHVSIPDCEISPLVELTWESYYYYYYYGGGA